MVDATGGGAVVSDGGDARARTKAQKLEKLQKEE